MLDAIFKIGYIQDIINEETVDLEQLKNLIGCKKKFIKDLDLNQLYDKINLCKTHFGSIILKNRILNPYENNTILNKINILIVKKSPEIKKYLQEIGTIQNTLINLINIPENHETLINNICFTDYFKKLNKYEYAIQAHVLINIYSPVYNILSPLIILVIPLMLSLLIPKKYINIFMNTFFIGIPNIKKLQYKTVGQIVYTLLNIVVFAYNLYNSIKTCLRTKKVIVFVEKKLNCFNEVVDILEKLNKIIPTEFQIPPKTTLNCSRGQLVLQYLNLPKKDEFKKIAMYIGKLDVYQTCAELIDKDYCLVDEINTKSPIIFMKNFASPLHNIKNNLFLKNKNLLITGPNAGGKTTLMKSTVCNVILAQTLGISRSDKMVYRRYDKILTNIVKTGGKMSLFQTEIKNLGEIIEYCKKETCLVALDEICSSTNSKEGSIVAYNIAKKLGECNSTTIITTHIDHLKKLEKNEKTYLNYHMKINRLGNAVEYTYKLGRGFSNETTVFDNINKLPIDIKKTK